MKVICINNKYTAPNFIIDDRLHTRESIGGKMDLTINKIYDVVKIDKFEDGDLCYKVSNDRGERCYYSHGRFLLPIEEYRQEQLEKII
jgi:hypothetical protein